MSKMFIDPPEGWKYGFPMEYDGITPVREFLVNNGYPKEKIDKMGNEFLYRTFNKGEDLTFQDLGKLIGKLVDQKNEKYGDSVLKPLSIFAGKCKAGTRLDDKLSRVKNADELRINDVTDIIGYLLITLKELNVGKEDIENLVD